jgi:preprotein translocase subunit SecD
MLNFPPWKIALIILTCVAGLVFSAPNLLSREMAESLPKWLPHQQINLGLDLRGGSHLLLEVGVDGLVQERLESLLDSVRTELRQGNIGYTGLGIAGKSVTLKLRDPEQSDAAVSALKKLATPVSSGLLGIGRGMAEFTVETDAGGTISLNLTVQAIAERARAAVGQSIEIVRRRVDETGVNEPSIQRQGSQRILVQLPGVDDPERVKRLLGKTAKMVFRMVDVNADPNAERAPVGSEILLADDELDSSGKLRRYIVLKRVEVSGDRLVDAQPGFDSRTSEPVVNFRFDSVGAKRFGETTRANVGKPFAIVLDDKIVSAPVIREPILGGTGQISGNFTVQGANDLAVLLRAGALPAPLQVLEERTVGPDLGADAIRAGIIAVAIGFVLVVAYMVAAYGFFGLLADFALLLNLMITIGVLSILQATLTLPGIAGLLLSIGMSVDANVLINERIREETKLGKTPLAALDAGFSRAYSTILDANTTTLLKMLLLFLLGSGAVKGFAVTVSIGIAASMFTAIVLVRLMMVTWARRSRVRALAV